MITRVSGMDLARIVTSEEFSTRLRDSSRVTAREQKETDFWVSLDPNNMKHSVSPYDVGTFIGMKIGSHGPERDLPESYFQMFHNHFHPEFTGPCVPSEGDLEFLGGEVHDFNLSGGYVKEYGAHIRFRIKFVNSIGKVRKDGGVELLFYQGRSYEPLNEGSVEMIDHELEEFFLGKGLPEGIENYIVHSGIRTREVARVLGRFLNVAVVNVDGRYLRSRYGMREYKRRNLRNLGRKLNKLGYEIKVVDEPSIVSRILRGEDETSS